MKALVLVLIFSISGWMSTESIAATYTSQANGAWTTTTSWTPTAPSGGPANTDVVIIKHTITRVGITATAWSGSITIQNGGRLQYTGNVSLTGSGYGITVQSGGSLEVSGSLTLQNQSSIILTGGTLTSGNLSIDGASFTSAAGSGSTATVGNFTLSNSGSSAFTNNAGNSFNVNGYVSTSKSNTNNGTMNITGNFDHNNGGGTLTNTGSITIGSTFTANATVNNSGTITTLNLSTPNSGGTFTNTGFVTVTMNANIAGSVQLSPGSSTDSRMTVHGSLNLSGSGLTVGNGVPGSPAKYADLVIAGNINQTSHNINVNCNGRVAVLGDLNLSGGGGLIFNINNCGSSGGVPIGGQVYIDGDGVGNSITNNSSGGQVNNNNPNFGTPSTPYGFYVNGPVGGSGSIDSDRATPTQMETTNPTFAAWVQSVMGPLPVTLLYLQCKTADDGIILNWATATEENADFFQIERSDNGITFESIGKESAAGNSKDLLKYDFKDDRPLEGKNYYRLKTVDFDGSYEYSKIISVNYEVSKNFNVYPNPYAGSDINFKTNFAPQEEDMIVVLNTMGIEVTRINPTGKEVDMDSSLKPGVYFFKYVSSNFQKTVRVVKAN